MIEKYCYVICSGDILRLGKCIIDSDNYIYYKAEPDGIPIEDLGDYLLSDDQNLSNDYVFETLLNHM